MELTKYYPLDIIRVADIIGGKLAYAPGVLQKWNLYRPEDSDGLNHRDVMVDSICEGVFLTLRQDLPWGGSDPFDSSIAVSFTKTKDKSFVVNRWFGSPVLIPGHNEWEKQGFRMEQASYGSWEEVAQCTIDGLINHLKKLETKVSEKWRDFNRMKIKKHIDDIREAANEFER